MGNNRLYPNYELQELLQNSSFKKWVQGIASPKEKQFWDEWVSASDKNRALAKKAQQKIIGFSIKAANTPDVAEALKDIDRKIRSKVRLHKVELTGHSDRNISKTKWLWRIAACLVLAAVVGIALEFVPVNKPSPKETLVKREVKTEYNERKSISLSDGSQIELNAHSTLFYTTSRADRNHIEVYLEGEAYFNVSKRADNTDTPFRVRTAAGEIEVMGTEFVVTARNTKTRVVLKEGSVAVNTTKSQEQVFLSPGEMAEFATSWDVVQTREVNTLVYSSWRTRKLIFDKTPLAEVVDRIESTFGVNVIVREPDLFKQKISGSVENAGLEVIISSLSTILKTSIRKSDQTIYVGN